MTQDGLPSNQHGPPPAEAAAAETRLKGHLGYLTAQEDTSLEEFRKLAADSGFYTPATDDKKASHDDGTLMYVDPTRVLHTTNPSVAAFCELGSSSLKRPSSSSRTQRYGAKTTTWKLCTRG